MKKPKDPRVPKKDHSFQAGGLGPRTGRQKTGIRWSGAFRKLMGLMRDMPRRAARKPAQRRDRVYHQRVTVRIRYSQNRAKGQWKAHGRYIERESAGAVGFNSEGNARPSENLAEWQAQGDERMWKVILSPEKDLDLEPYTKELMKRVEVELGQPLIWTAAVHSNTEHNHVHLVIRGIDKNGQSVKLSPGFVKEGLRMKAQALATEILGHRLDQDIVLVERKSITQARYTDLDRMIVGRIQEGTIFVNTEGLSGLKVSTEEHLRQRLNHLQTMGLAEKVSEHSWKVSEHLESSLRAVQQTRDLQQMQDRFGVLASDPSLPFQRTDWKEIDKLEGRVLVHGQEDNKEAAYMLVEDVNGIIRMLDHRNEIVASRQQGLLQPGTYIAMRKSFVGKTVKWTVEDFGPAEACVTDPDFLDRCVKRGVKSNHGYGGWLGKFRDAMKTRSVGLSRAKRSL